MIGHLARTAIGGSLLMLFSMVVGSGSGPLFGPFLRVLVVRLPVRRQGQACAYSK
jgi:hypothetical protein